MNATTNVCASNCLASRSINYTTWTWRDDGLLKKRQAVTTGINERSSFSSFTIREPLKAKSFAAARVLQYLNVEACVADVIVMSGTRQPLLLT
jgi:hypothetical protein